ncbi:hypothetical protein BRAS3843_2020029 [Bradyrhizobium sp. STM 3843]|nr:hypothetical protein BRAS3843_2020029 [Bradyrhizobium sp. STM 3843]
MGRRARNRSAKCYSLSVIRYSGFRKSLTKLTLDPINSKADCVRNDYIAASRARRLPNRAINKVRD